MWCTECRQDVPGIVSPSDSVQPVVCARCGHELTSPTTEFSRVDKPHRRQSTVPRANLLGLDEWDSVDQDLHSAKLKAQAWQSHTESETTQGKNALEPHSAKETGDTTDVQRRIDVVGVAAQQSTRVSNPQPSAFLATNSRSLSWTVWLLVCGGMMTLTFGSVLCGWSWTTGRGELWRVGLPALLIGQVVLLLGFVFQLDGIWRTHRQTRDALNGLDRQLHELAHYPSSSPDRSA
ncbi:MAG: hypothetical protein KDA60_16600 [Planctomycetales bacterium]|nr:hypothetical protein [Planctomycetales bacterium]